MGSAGSDYVVRIARLTIAQPDSRQRKRKADSWQPHERRSMGKPADIEPRWLVSLMCVWAVHERASDNRHMGYPNKVAWLSIPSGNTAYADPTGYCAQDFTELERALDDLRESHLGQFMAMMCYYKPWGIKACVEAGWPFGDSTYYARLHAAHSKVAASIDRLREAA